MLEELNGNYNTNSDTNINFECDFHPSALMRHNLSKRALTADGYGVLNETNYSDRELEHEM